jgi:hypothetical protein
MLQLTSQCPCRQLLQQQRQTLLHQAAARSPQSLAAAQVQQTAPQGLRDSSKQQAAARTGYIYRHSAFLNMLLLLQIQGELCALVQRWIRCHFAQDAPLRKALPDN